MSDAVGWRAAESVVELFSPPTTAIKNIRCRWMAFSPPTTAALIGILKRILFGILFAGGENAIQRLFLTAMLRLPRKLILKEKVSGRIFERLL